jgi:hypothetical protein
MLVGVPQSAKLLFQVYLVWIWVSVEAEEVYFGR